MFHWIQLWWDTWNLRAVILFSLFSQTFLYFSAPLRKRTSNSLVIVPIWLAYNLANATAIFGVGLISKPCGNALGPYANPELMAFWAPFLLLHLGGPDTITAFALQDNELWLRHLLQLVVQLANPAYVFILTLSSNNQLWLPTLLVFISALMKSMEWIHSLYLASWRRFHDSMLRKPDPGPNYHKLMDEYFSNQQSSLPSHLEIVEPPNPEPSAGDNNELLPDVDAPTDPNLLEAVYHHFETVKGLIADLKISSSERDKSRSFFLKLTPKQAFASVEIELNFLHDILFTETALLSVYYRKQTANSLVTVPIWLAYNLADATAIFGVGVISKPCGKALGPYANPKLVALWAPFLLLHFGGPDTIIAFALKDNELRLRHLLQLVVQLATSAYVFILTLSSNNQLWLPTLLIFVSALIKSIERNRSLYLASWRRFRDSMLREPNPGPNYHTLMDEYFSNQELGLPSRLEIVEAHNPEPIVGENNEPMPDLSSSSFLGIDLELLEAAYRHFETVKGLIADLKFTFHERNKSRSFFLELTAKQAFESVTIELNFLYDILFTKTQVIHGYHRKWDKFIGNLGLTKILDKRKYVTTERFNEVLRDFIFEELRIKSMGANAIEIAKEFCLTKGDWVLKREGGCDNLLPYTLHADYDKILILWHIATELCYNTEEGNSENQKFREISKVLSDYMIYLLIMEPSMMSTVAGTAQMRFRDTCAEAKLLFQDKGVLEKEEKYSCFYNMNSPCLNACCCNEYTTRRNEYRRRSNISILDLNCI
ncbi:hypothetical protein Vadar_033440 [Vaccinium darrowii]|uniref:Uncharacterized protein n=1 Tax=Vaccinium darrowii TaxID=229202 RepID=A0ACB7Z2A2_9ERIC|nr:hypothetical protein Vadar_033440 [Vaccinium darrowii]